MAGRAWSSGPIALRLVLHGSLLEPGRTLSDYLGGVVDSLDDSHGSTFTYLPITYEDDCQVVQAHLQLLEDSDPSYEVVIEFLEDNTYRMV